MPANMNSQYILRFLLSSVESDLWWGCCMLEW